MCSQIERRRNSLTTEEFGGVYLGPSSQEATKTEETQAAATVLMRRRASLIERKFFSSSAIRNFLSESNDAGGNADDQGYSH